MDEMDLDYCDYLDTMTVGPGAEFVSMQELCRLHSSSSDTVFSPTSTTPTSTFTSVGDGLSRQVSRSNESNANWLAATNGLVMRSPHQSGVALRWIPVSEAYLSRGQGKRTTSASTDEDSGQGLATCSSLLSSQSNYDSESEPQDDCPSSTPGKSSSSLAATGQIPHTPDLMHLNDQAIETVNDQSQIDQANQGDEVGAQRSKLRLNTCETRRASAARERRKLQNRKAQQAYRARREQILLTLQGQLAAVSDQLVSSNERHAIDMEEITRLTNVLSQVKHDNKTLRDWVKLIITSNGFDSVLTMLDKQGND